MSTPVDDFSALHPRVAAWCRETLGSATLPQRGAFAPGMAGRDHLIVSPTGTGKTLAAFLPAFSKLAARIDADELFPRTYVLYISPLRALGYDVEHNVRRPLREMGLLERPNSPRAEIRGGRLRERTLRTGVRTGDTPTEERRLMLSRPPHILLTTPESLALLTAMPSYRKSLQFVDTVIIDEIHALANSKRGVQLMLVLENLLECTAPREFMRVGLSATVAPLDRVAAFVSGPERPCEIVDARVLRAVDLSVEAVSSGAITSLQKIAGRAIELSRDEGTSLIFTNVRSQAERVAHEMEEALPDVAFAEELKPNERRNRRIGVHHSSLERSVRHRLEAQLRKGELRTVVCSASLELGVDIGFIDRVLLVGGARSMTSTLQRVGRSGHRPGAVAQGIILAQDRDDILEGAAVMRCVRELIIDEIEVPHAPLDVLAQWITASVIPDRKKTVAELCRAARRTLAYADLEEADVLACAKFLSGGGAGDESASVRRVGLTDDVVFGLGREPSAAFYENVGTIPDERTVQVSSRGQALGRLDESFVGGLRLGDVFLLSGRTVRVKEIRDSEVKVEPHAGRPSVPAWSSHLKGLSPQLAAAVGRIRAEICEHLRDHSAEDFLVETYGLRPREAAIAVGYVRQQQAVSVVPDGSRCVIEIYRMDDRQSVVFHTCAGRRINEALSRMVAARVHARLGHDCRITTDDGAFLIVLEGKKEYDDAVWATMLEPANFDADLLTGLRGSTLLRRHFRYIANTALLVLRRANGRQISRRGQWNAGAIFERLWTADPEFPLVRETVRTVCDDLLDRRGAHAFVRDSPPPILVHPAAASPFTFGVVSSSFGDTVNLIDRETIIEALHARILSLIETRDDTPADNTVAESPAGTPAKKRATVTGTTPDVMKTARRKPMPRRRRLT